MYCYIIQLTCPWHHSVGSGSGVSCGGLYCLRQQSCRLARMVGGELQLARGGPAHVSVSVSRVLTRVPRVTWTLAAGGGTVSPPS